MRKKTLLMVAVLLTAVFNPVMAQWGNRSKEAANLLSYMQDIYGKKTISGACANVNWNTNEAQWVHKHTGKWPALNTFDYIQHVYSWMDYSNTKVVEDWYAAGGIVSIMWHWNVPSNGGGYGFYYGWNNDETTFDVTKIWDQNSWEYRLMIQDIDKIAGYLKLLKNKNIPVLWRPLHEAGGRWFWWGRDAEACKQLWKVMYQRFANAGLDNLIWMFTPAAGWNEPYSKGFDWYPGDEYVDIVGMDVYNEGNAYDCYNKCFKFLNDIKPNKMAAMMECGNVATISSQWNAGAKWLFFMPWYDYGRTNNPNSSAFNDWSHSSASISWWNDAFNCDFVITRDQVPNFSTYVSQGGNGGNSGNGGYSSVEKPIWKTIYDNGDVAMGEWTGFINTMPAEMFKDVLPGDVVRVYIKNRTGGWQQGAFKNGATWDGLTNELGVIGLSDADFSKGYYEMTFDNNTLAQVQANGLIVSGCNYTATKVVLLKNETSLYNGNVAMGNWSGYINNLSPEMFADAKVGDNIRVYISNPTGDYQQGSFKNGSTWEGLNSDLDAFSLTGNDFGKGYFEMTLDENTLAQVKANGLIVSGCNYTASKVALIKNSYNEGAADAVLYDDGNVDMNEWTGFINTMGAGLFSDAKVGDNIRVYISNPTGGWQQGAFKNGATWEGLTTELGVIGLTSEDFARGYYEMTLDENTLAQVQTSGLIVSGCNYTASKVILIKNEAALYDNGSVDMEDWNGFINTMGADLFEDVRIGDKVRVYISNPTGDWQQGAFKNGSTWQGLTDELGVIGLSSKDFEKGYYEMTFDENTLTQVQANGLIVSGCHYTADKVTLIRCGEGSNPRNSQSANNIYNVNVFQKMGAANVYYNLGGQRFSTPQKGINIVNGKKIVVK